MAVTAESFKHKKSGSYLSVGFASSEKEVNECLELRYQVFAREMGARIRSSDTNRQVDRDEYDAGADIYVLQTITLAASWPPLEY